MIIFQSIQNDPAQPGYGQAQENGRIWIEKGRIRSNGSLLVMDIASKPLQTVFDGLVDPTIEPERFLFELLVKYHYGTYSWAAEVPDDTPPQAN